MHYLVKGSGSSYNKGNYGPVLPWVGRLKNLAMFDRVEDDLLWDIGADVTPKYMGDDLILLLGLTDAKAEQMIQEEIEGGESLFYSLEKWNPRIRTGYRLTWV